MYMSSTNKANHNPKICSHRMRSACAARHMQNIASLQQRTIKCVRSKRDASAAKCDLANGESACAHTRKLVAFVNENAITADAVGGCGCCGAGRRTTMRRWQV